MAVHERCLVCRGQAFEPLPRYERVKLVRCLDCGMIFCPIIPTEEELRDHYEGYSSESGISSVSIGRRDEILARMDVYRHTNRLLDVGCGRGEFLDQAKQHGWETHGTEFSEEALDSCRRRGHIMNRTPLRSVIREAGSFDVVICTEVLEHISTQREEVREIARLLRPGGVLYATTPNFGSLARIVLRDRWSVIQFPEHLAYFTPDTLGILMDREGLAPVEVRTTGFSVRRFVKSLKSDLPTGPEPPADRVTSIDEQLREALERPYLKPIKRGLNQALDRLRCGDKIVGWYARKTR